MSSRSPEAKIETLEAPELPGEGCSDEEWDAAWRTELAERLDDFDSGRVQGIPWRESHARLLEKLAALHRKSA